MSGILGSTYRVPTHDDWRAAINKMRVKYGSWFAMAKGAGLSHSVVRRLYNEPKAKLSKPCLERLCSFVGFPYTTAMADKWGSNRMGQYFKVGKRKKGRKKRSDYGKSRTTPKAVDVDPMPEFLGGRKQSGRYLILDTRTGSVVSTFGG